MVYTGVWQSLEGTPSTAEAENYGNGLRIGQKSSVRRVGDEMSNRYMSRLSTGMDGRINKEDAKRTKGTKG